ncbi:autotransporter assembly complex family protein [Legionella sp. W05-934-2]|uniref:autotransporter assembly complex protein TamA n=1 Tax=Legionella sp. W05-934-2 TaxID=1198649 RepID=UPI003461E653
MKTHLIRGIVLSLLVSTAALGKTTINIRGVSDSLLTNVNSRLNEYNEKKPLNSQSDKTIIEQVKLALSPYGYFSPEIKLFRNASNFPSTISIAKGQPTRISQLDIKVIGPGRENPQIVKALLDLPIQRGQIFNSESYEDAKKALFDAAEHEGYLKSRFETSIVLVDKRSYSASITLLFNTNKQYFFGKVHFNKTRLSPHLLHRFIPFQFAMPYRTDKIITLNNDLSGSGYFKHVNVKPHINSQTYVPISVHLDPVSRYNYTLGVGYGTDTGPRGRAGLSIVPLNEYGHKFNLIAQGSMTQNALQAQYVIPGFNPVTDEYDLTVTAGDQDFSSGYSNSVLLTAAARHHKKHFQRILSLNALYERYNYNNLNLPRTESGTFFPRGLLSWHHGEGELFSKNGYNVTFTALAASRRVLSKNDLGQVDGDLKVAVTSNFLRVRLFAHTIQGITLTNNINNVPLSLAFLLGGADNLKGYGYNSIGPGKQVEFYGIELQKEMKDDWYLIGFVDAGDVYNPLPRLMKYDAGAGIMWVSPVGPIKVGLAQAVNSNFQRVRGRNPRLVISMGPDLA